MTGRHVTCVLTSLVLLVMILTSRDPLNTLATALAAWALGTAVAIETPADRAEGGASRG